MAGCALHGDPVIVAVNLPKSDRDVAQDAVRLATAAFEMRGEEDATGRIHDSLQVERQFAGSAYAQPTAEAEAAPRWLAAQGGWVPDRVYGTRPLDRDSVVLWRTGGLPTFLVTGGAPPGEPSPTKRSRR